MVGFSDEKLLTFVESRMHLAIESFERLKCVRALLLPSPQLDIYEKLKASSRVDLPIDLTYRRPLPPPPISPWIGIQLVEVRTVLPF